MEVGVLALQGDFARHQERLSELGSDVRLIRHAGDLNGLNGLVIPGGESTTLLRLLDDDFSRQLSEFINGGMPTLATCAGAILLARKVTGPSQESLSLIDIDIARNAYGRQLDSFIEPALNWTEAGEQALIKLEDGTKLDTRVIEGIFIRAPSITRTGSRVSVLATRDSEPVLVREGNILVATFHPELTDRARAVHQMLVRDAGEYRG